MEWNIFLKMVGLRKDLWENGDKTFKMGTLSSILVVWGCDLFWRYLALIGFIELESTGVDE